MPKSYLIRTRVGALLFVVLILLLASACASIPLLSGEMPDSEGTSSDEGDFSTGTEPTQSGGGTAQTPLPPTAKPPKLSEGASGGSQIFTSDTFGLSFAFPADWYGPEVVEHENGLRVEVGSDVVYPYGTGREDQIYEEENSYYVVLQYRLNPGAESLEELRGQQPWMEQYFTLLALADGESESGPRAKVTRSRPVETAGFEGIEYVSTLSESAQTERYYVREVILLDESLNELRLTGSPNNVVVPDPAAWREAYRQVDEANLEIFRAILRSISRE